MISNWTGLAVFCFAVGPSAGSSVEGDNNVAIGQNTGASVTGDFNVGVGTWAGLGSTGDENLAFGNRAGNNVVGDSNLALGNDAGTGVNASGTIRIGDNDTTRTAILTAPSPMLAFRLPAECVSLEMRLLAAGKALPIEQLRIAVDSPQYSWSC